MTLADRADTDRYWSMQSVLDRGTSGRPVSRSIRDESVSARLARPRSGSYIDESVEIEASHPGMISDGLCFSVSGAEPGVAFYLIVAGNSRPGRRIGDLINKLLRLSFQLSVRGIINTASSFSRKVRELVAIVAHCPATRLWLLMFASGGKQRKTKKTP